MKELTFQFSDNVRPFNFLTKVNENRIAIVGFHLIPVNTMAVISEAFHRF